MYDRVKVDGVIRRSKMPSAAYLAGMVDGDGTISFQTRDGAGSSGHNTGPYVSIMQCKPDLILLLGYHLGGLLRIRNLKAGNFRVQYEWTVYDERAIRFVEIIHKHLVLKKHRADLVLEYYRSCMESTTSPEFFQELRVRNEAAQKELIVAGDLCDRYIAGFFDAEGCAALDYKGESRDYVTITQEACPAMLHAIRDYFGVGSVDGRVWKMTLGELRKNCERFPDPKAIDVEQRNVPDRLGPYLINKQQELFMLSEVARKGPANQFMKDLSWRLKHNNCVVDSDVWKDLQKHAADNMALKDAKFDLGKAIRHEKNKHVYEQNRQRMLLHNPNKGKEYTEKELSFIGSQISAKKRSKFGCDIPEDSVIDAIRADFAEGLSNVAVMNKYGIERGTASKIKNGEIGKSTEDGRALRAQKREADMALEETLRRERPDATAEEMARLRSAAKRKKISVEEDSHLMEWLRRNPQGTFEPNKILLYCNSPEGKKVISTTMTIDMCKTIRGKYVAQCFRGHEGTGDGEEKDIDAKQIAKDLFGLDDDTYLRTKLRGKGWPTPEKLIQEWVKANGKCK
jgi:hypothetical protein